MRSGAAGPGVGLVAAALLAAAAAAASGCGGGDGDGPGGGAISACGFADGEPNDNPARATPYAPGAAHDGCLLGNDVDFISIAGPDDYTGGQVDIVVGDVAGGPVRVRIFDAGGTVEVASFVASGAGAPLELSLAMAPGKAASIAVSDAGGGAAAAYSYKVTSSYRAVPDAYEPNDSASSAARVQVGEVVQPYLMAGGGDGMAAFDDFFTFTAFFDTVTVTMEDVPANVAARLFLYRADGTEVARVQSGLKGGSLTLKPGLPLDPDNHVLRVSLWADAPPIAWQGTPAPANMAAPYKLTIAQP